MFFFINIFKLGRSGVLIFSMAANLTQILDFKAGASPGFDRGGGNFFFHSDLDICMSRCDVHAAHGESMRFVRGGGGGGGFGGMPPEKFF